MAASRKSFTITSEWAELLVRSSVDPSTEWVDMQRRFDYDIDYAEQYRGLRDIRVLVPDDRRRERR